MLFKFKFVPENLVLPGFKFDLAQPAVIINEIAAMQTGQHVTVNITSQWTVVIKILIIQGCHRKQLTFQFSQINDKGLLIFAFAGFATGQQFFEIALFETG